MKRNSIILLFNQWFTRPMNNAAGRLGLFRILFALFYLWHLSVFPSYILDKVPSSFLRYEVGLRVIFPDQLPANFFEITEAVFVGLLSLLLVGWRTRLVTILLLIPSCMIEIAHVSTVGGNSRTFLSFYILFFIILCGNNWGSTYSLDAIRAESKGKTAISPKSDSWIYAFPFRAIHIVFVFHFFTAVIFKLLPSATFLNHPHLLATEWMTRSIFLIAADFPYNSLNYLMHQMPGLDLFFRYFIVGLEALFCLTLLHWRIMRFFLGLLLIFHAVNGLWLGVTFTPILVVYLIFIDWQKIKEQLFRTELKLPFTGSPQFNGFLAVSFSLIMGVLWWNSHYFRSFFNGYGLISWQTIWYPVLLLASIYFVFVLWDELRRWKGRSSTLLYEGIQFLFNIFRRPLKTE